MGKLQSRILDSDAAGIDGVLMLITLSFHFCSWIITSGAKPYWSSTITLSNLMGMTPGIKAFVAAVLGGIGIIPGAALGWICYSVFWRHYQPQLVCQVTVMPSFGALITSLVRPAGILAKM